MSVHSHNMKLAMFTRKITQDSELDTHDMVITEKNAEDYLNKGLSKGLSVLN